MVCRMTAGVIQVPFSLLPCQYDKYARRSFRRCASPAPARFLEQCGRLCESGFFRPAEHGQGASRSCRPGVERACAAASGRSEEHTSELQSRENLVCRLLLEKKKE